MGYMSIFAIIMKFTTVALFTVFISMFCSCGSSPDDEKAMPAQSAPAEKAIKEQFVKANQLLVEREKDMMDYTMFINRPQLVTALNRGCW